MIKVSFFPTANEAAAKVHFSSRSHVASQMSNRITEYFTLQILIWKFSFNDILNVSQRRITVMVYVRTINFNYFNFVYDKLVFFSVSLLWQLALAGLPVLTAVAMEKMPDGDSNLFLLIVDIGEKSWWKTLFWTQLLDIYYLPRVAVDFWL